MPLRIRKGLGWVFGLPSKAAIALIAVYQTVFSPLKFLLFGGAGSCRFYPTCSSYARESILRHGLLIGVALSVWRLLKCHPFHPGGFDPVPARPGIFRRCGCVRKPSDASPPGADGKQRKPDYPVNQPASGRLRFRLRRLLHG